MKPVPVDLDPSSCDYSPEKTSPTDAEAPVIIDPRKEKAVIRKFDLFVLPQFVIIMVLAYLDRTNIGILSFTQTVRTSRCTQILT